MSVKEKKSKADTTNTNTNNTNTNTNTNTKNNGFLSEFNRLSLSSKLILLIGLGMVVVGLLLGFGVIEKDAVLPSAFLPAQAEVVEFVKPEPEPENSQNEPKLNFIGEGGCGHATVFGPIKKCNANIQCRVVAKQPNGCWHLLTGHIPSEQQISDYTTMYKRDINNNYGEWPWRI